MDALTVTNPCEILMKPVEMKPGLSSGAQILRHAVVSSCDPTPTLPANGEGVLYTRRKRPVLPLISKRQDKITSAIMSATQLLTERLESVVYKYILLIASFKVC